jgi:hypothetical protein
VSELRDWVLAEWDRAAGVSLIVVGVVFLIIGYVGVANSAYIAEQLAYLASGGLGGLICVGTGATLLILAALHDEWRKLDRIEAAIRGDRPPAAPAPPPGAALEVAEMRATNGADRGDRQPIGAEQTIVAFSGSPTAAHVSAAGEAPARAIPLVFAAFGLAMVPVLVGWHQAAGTGQFHRAVNGVEVSSVGAAALAALGGGLLLWQRYRIGTRKLRLLGTWLLEGTLRDRHATSALGATPAISSRGTVVVGESMTRFHAPGCPAARGEVQEVPLASVDASLRPCGLCLFE